MFLCVVFVEVVWMVECDIIVCLFCCMVLGSVLGSFIIMVVVVVIGC